MLALIRMDAVRLAFTTWSEMHGSGRPALCKRIPETNLQRNPEVSGASCAEAHGPKMIRLIGPLPFVVLQHPPAEATITRPAFDARKTYPRSDAKNEIEITSTCVTDSDSGRAIELAYRTCGAIRPSGRSNSGFDKTLTPKVESCEKTQTNSTGSTNYAHHQS